MPIPSLKPQPFKRFRVVYYVEREIIITAQTKDHAEQEARKRVREFIHIRRIEEQAE